MDLNYNYEGASKEALLKINELEADIKNLYNKINSLNNSLSNFEQSKILYDKDSSDSNINWGLPSGWKNTTISGKNFNEFKRLKIFYCLGGWGSNGIIEVDLSRLNFTYATYYASNIASYNDTGVNYFGRINVYINAEKTNIQIKLIDGTVLSSNAKHCVYKIEGIK